MHLQLGSRGGMYGDSCLLLNLRLLEKFLRRYGRQSKRRLGRLSPPPRPLPLPLPPPPLPRVNSHGVYGVERSPKREHGLADPPFPLLLLSPPRYSLRIFVAVPLFPYKPTLRR
nr:hypothetical protein HmN_000978000 [Hymenolepis microstoma]